MAANGIEFGTFETGEDLQKDGRTLLQQQEHAGVLDSAGENAVLWSIVMI